MKHADAVWHTQDERPSVPGPVSGLVAIPGDGDIVEPLLIGLMTWKDGQWRDEDTDKPMRPYPRYWWCLEVDLLAGLA